MALICEDLAQYGVVLIPRPRRNTSNCRRYRAEAPSAAQGFAACRDDDLSRISEHDTAASAILLNRATVAIASIAYVWSFRGPNGRITTGSVSSESRVLLPFAFPNDRMKKFDAFWNTIFPGSKRLLTADGGRYGDNTDVRQPVADELSSGGFGGIGTGGHRGVREPVKLTLDGVFFVDGGFAGPNQRGTWEQVVFAREAHLAFSNWRAKSAKHRRRRLSSSLMCSN